MRQQCADAAKRHYPDPYKFTKEQVLVLCGGEFPHAGGWDRVEHFTAHPGPDGTTILTAMDGEDPLPVTGLVVSVRDVNRLSHLIDAHREAMDCRDCEAFLQLGIDAFNWLVRADKLLRKAECANHAENAAKVHNCIQTLLIAWLETCDAANKWVREQLRRGFTVDNLDEFRKCEEEVRAIVDSFENDSLTDAMCDLRDASLVEHRNGETAEFV